MTIWEELGLLFTEMSPWTIILLIVGSALIILDAFDTGFDITGISGLAAVIGGIVLRMINGGTLLMLVVMLLIVSVIVFLSVFLIFRSAEKGWLSRTALFDKTPAVPYDKTEGTPDYSSLIGMTGKTETVLKPVGKVKIDNTLYDAVCECFIEKGLMVEVIGTEGYKITVRAK